jgi:hypothetical protein
MTASAVLDNLMRRGGTARVLPTGKLRIEPATVVDEALLAELKEQRDEIIAELRRREPKPDETALTRHGVLCRSCRRLGRGYGDQETGYVCPACVEWRVTGCAAFTALERADEAAEARYGACLSCGGSIELHGSPDPSKWRRVASHDDVEIAAVRYVLASAGAIAREARR